jgi:hypothetical protein
MFVFSPSGTAARFASCSSSSIAEMIKRRWCMPLPIALSW